MSVLQLAALAANNGFLLPIFENATLQEQLQRFLNTPSWFISNLLRALVGNGSSGIFSSSDEIADIIQTGGTQGGEKLNECIQKCGQKAGLGNGSQKPEDIILSLNRLTSPEQIQSVRLDGEKAAFARELLILSAPFVEREFAAWLETSRHEVGSVMQEKITENIDQYLNIMADARREAHGKKKRCELLLEGLGLLTNHIPPEESSAIDEAGQRVIQAIVDYEENLRNLHYALQECRFSISVNAS